MLPVCGLLPHVSVCVSLRQIQRREGERRGAGRRRKEVVVRNGTRGKRREEGVGGGEGGEGAVGGW